MGHENTTTSVSSCLVTITTISIQMVLEPELNYAISGNMAQWRVEHRAIVAETSFKSNESCTPVSYTHLDVYKRQA